MKDRLIQPDYAFNYKKNEFCVEGIPLTELMDPKKLINNSGNTDFSSFNLKMNTIFAMRSNKILSKL